MDISLQLICINKILGSTAAELCEKSALNFLRNCQTAFQSNCFAFPPAVCESSSCSTSLLAFGIVSFGILAILIGVYWYLIVVLIFIFLITYDVEHLFLCLFSTYVSFLVRCLFRSFAHLKIWYSFSYLLSIFWITVFNTSIFFKYFLLFSIFNIKLSHDFYSYSFLQLILFII